MMGNYEESPSNTKGQQNQIKSKTEFHCKQIPRKNPELSGDNVTKGKFGGRGSAGLPGHPKDAAVATALQRAQGGRVCFSSTASPALLSPGTPWDLPCTTAQEVSKSIWKVNGVQAEPWPSSDELNRMQCDAVRSGESGSTGLRN